MGILLRPLGNLRTGAQKAGQGPTLPAARRERKGGTAFWRRFSGSLQSLAGVRLDGCIICIRICRDIFGEEKLDL